jgi:hypothetical protein
MTTREPSNVRVAARIVGGAVAVLFLSTILYVSAFHAPRPRSYDVGVVGPAAAAASLQDALDGSNRGAFDVRGYDTEFEARAALLDTKVHGVFMPRPRGDRILVAQALGMAATQAVTDALRGVASKSRTPVAVRDVRPLPSSDRRGLSSVFIVIATIFPSLVAGVLLSVLGRRLSWRLRWAAVLAYALAAGLVVAFNVHVVVGAFGSEFLGIALVSGLFALAVSAAAHGLTHLGGPPGIGLAVVVLLLVGVSAGGGAVGYEFEPGFYGAVSQLLPPGAAVTAVRNVEYFDWAATLAPIATLAVWAVGGLAVGLLGDVYGPHVRRPRGAATGGRGRSSTLKVKTSGRA